MNLLIESTEENGKVTVKITIEKLLDSDAARNVVKCVEVLLQAGETDVQNEVRKALLSAMNDANRAAVDQ